MPGSYNLPIFAEIGRKVVHLLGVIIPIIYHFTDKKTMTTIIAILLITSFCMDKLRVKFNVTNHPFSKKIGLFKIFRIHEQNSFSALTFAFIGMIICVVISSKPVFNLAVSILILSDTIAAIVGILFGIHKINGKSVEGSISFFLTSCILSLVITAIYGESFGFLLAAIFSSLIATFAELFSKNNYLNDNMSIPISVSVVMCILESIRNLP